MRSAPIGSPSTKAAVRPLSEFGASFVVAFIAASTLTWLFALLLRAIASPSAPSGPTSPEKVARLFLIASFLVAYFRIRTRDGARFVVTTGFAGLRPGLRDVGLGFVVGAASLAALLAVSLRLGWWAPIDRGESLTAVAAKLAGYVGAGLFVALWEEGLFRGVLFRDFRRAGGTPFALVGTSAIFAVAHFLNPFGRVASSWDAPWIGAASAWANVEGLARIPSALPYLAGMFLVAIVLGTVRIRARSTWPCVGVHAGWVFITKADGRFFEFRGPTDSSDRIWSGSVEYADGVFGWCALLLTCALIVPLLRPRAEREEEPS